MNIKCPNCKGEGKISGYGCPGFKLIEMTCDICKGAGEIEAGTYRPEKGQALKNARKILNLSLRESAKTLGLTATELSRQERGYFL